MIKIKPYNPVKLVDLSFLGICSISSHHSATKPASIAIRAFGSKPISSQPCLSNLSICNPLTRVRYVVSLELQGSQDIICTFEGKKLRDQRRYFSYLLFILILTTVLVGLTWVNFRYSMQNPGGSDFLPRWLGTRLFLLTGESPYSDQTSEQIQQQFYGRTASPEEDQVLFVYPFYSIFIFGPFALIPDYNIARAVWMTALEIAVLGIALIGIRLSRWKPGPLGLGLLLLFALLYYYDLRALINANASILVALLVFTAFIAIRANEDAWAGFLLALATIKPQMVVLLLVFIIIWSISNRRNLIIWSLLGNLALMIAISSLLIPDWIWQMLRQVIAYPDYTLPNTPRAIFLEWLPGVGEQLGWGLLILMTATLIWEWRLARGKEFRWFYWTANLTLVGTSLIGIPTATENYIILLPCLLLVFSGFAQEWGTYGRFLIVLSYLLLSFGIWWLFLATLQVGDQPVQNPSLFFLLPVYLIFGLYGIRWRILRPERPLFDQWRDKNRLIN